MNKSVKTVLFIFYFSLIVSNLGHFREKKIVEKNLFLKVCACAHACLCVSSHIE